MAGQAGAASPSLLQAQGKLNRVKHQFWSNLAKILRLVKGPFFSLQPSAGRPFHVLHSKNKARERHTIVA
jgi:hypothetical protein